MGAFKHPSAIAFLMARNKSPYETLKVKAGSPDVIMLGGSKAYLAIDSRVVSDGYPFDSRGNTKYGLTIAIKYFKYRHLFCQRIKTNDHTWSNDTDSKFDYSTTNILLRLPA